MTLSHNPGVHPMAAQRSAAGDEAVDLLREAFAQGRQYGIWRHRDPTLEPLRCYPPFEELVRPEG